jgi:N-acetylmuramoyl-L-alanine amidase
VGTVTVVTTPTSPPATCPVLRWAGTTAPATNVMIGIRVAPAATSVVIVPSLTAHRQDAALAGTLAYAKKAPVLVADQTSVSKEVLAEITRRRATTAYVVASGSGLTSTVDTQLKAAGITTIVNVRGGERIETAAVAAKSLGGARPTVFLVSSAVARSRDAILATAAGASAGSTPTSRHCPR